MPPKPEAVSELAVRVTPRSSRNKFELTDGGGLHAWTTAPPTDGQANDALCEMFAKAAGLPKSAVEVCSGHTSRNKRLRFHGVSQPDLMRRLGTRAQ